MRRLAALAIALLATAIVALTTGATAATAAPATLGAPFTSPDGLWTWSRPLPHGYPAYAIAAPAPGTLFATTSEPDLLVTTDGGTSWAWSRTSAVLGFGSPEGVLFTSAQEGWTWGLEAATTAVLLRTTDGGADWQPSLTWPSEPAALRVVRFAGPLDGWVVTGDYENPVLYTTTDGGQSWGAPLTLPETDYTSFAVLVPQGATQAVLFQTLYSAGAGNGDLVGTSVQRTTDGGTSWSAPTMLKGADIEHAVVASPDQGWATDDSWLWGTTDGGASWHKVRPAPGSDALTVTGNGIWAIPRLIGVPRPYALHSTDGGATWQKVPGLFIASLAFCDPLDGWMIRDGYFHTTDGGTTWTRVTSAPKTAVTDLAAAPDGTVWAAADYVIRSTNAGASWKRVTQRRRLLAVTAVSADQAWAIGRGGVIIHTTDGGLHWVQQPSGVRVHLRHVFFADARHGWVGGDDGTFLRTTDGGRHWTAKHFGHGGRIGTLSFADARHGIALVGAPGGAPGTGIISTTNGGATWSWTHLSRTKDRPTTVSMEDSTHALIIAHALDAHFSHSWTTGDGGKTWQQGTNLPNAESYAALARAAAELCAVGQGGSVVTSTNDGLTWSYDGAPSSARTLTGVQFVGSDTLMIGGWAGVLTRDLIMAPLP
jgi:photosystem II stability/assembly factor-like uncharacterized protein